MTDRATILVVDDEPGMVRTATRILEGAHRVLRAGSGEEALTILARGDVDLALVDVRMPEPDGFALLRTIRQRWPQTDVILMTGSVAETDQKLVQAIEQGAFYFITKPFERAVLLALVQRCLHLRRMDQERQQREQQLRAELQLARSFQQSLLPKSPRRLGPFTIWSLLRPAVELSGDFVDHGACADGQPWAFLADVCGHGAAAAMVTGIIKAALAATIGAGKNPALAAAALRTAARSLPDDMFFTCFLGWVEGDVLRYVNAGHPPGLAWTGDGVQELAPTEPMAHPDLVDDGAAPAAAPFPPGARLLLYSDGLSEARNPQGEQFGSEPLAALLPKAPPAEMLDSALAALDRFADGRPQHDDHALLLLARD